MVKCIKILVLVFASTYFPVSAFAPSQLNFSAIIDTSHWKLYSNPPDFTLEFLHNEGKKQISIPGAWLILPHVQQAEQESYVSSFNFAEPVTSFTIGVDRIGIHLSSYDILQEGSARASAGRDVFLVYSLTDHQLYPGKIELGITKERIRSGGLWQATHTNFFVADINHDDLNDIGLMKEELTCTKFRPDRTVINDRRRPGYKIYAIQWYVFKKDYWEYDDTFDGRLTTHINKLPLIGIVKSPVAFVKEICFHDNIHIMDYFDFGPQAMAYELIGYEWYQWHSHGEPDPHTKYDIRIAVYKDISLEQVKSLYPVMKELNQDYRYLEYGNALEYLDNQIKEMESFLTNTPAPEDSALYRELNSLLLMTKSEIIDHLN